MKYCFKHVKPGNLQIKTINVKCFGNFILEQNECSPCESGNVLQQQSDGTCEQCPVQCGDICGSVLGDIKCIKCPDGQFLNPEIETCSECNGQEVYLFNGIAICRNSKIYVNSENNSGIQIGTKTFPYLTISQALNEIQISMSTYKNIFIQILLPEGTIQYITPQAIAALEGYSDIEITTECSSNPCVSRAVLKEGDINSPQIFSPIDPTLAEIENNLMDSDLINEIQSQQYLIHLTQTQLKIKDVKTYLSSKLLWLKNSSLTMGECQFETSQQSQLLKTHPSCSSSSNTILIENNEFIQSEQRLVQRMEPFMRIDSDEEVMIQGNVFEAANDLQEQIPFISFQAQCEELIREIINNQIDLIDTQQSISFFINELSGTYKFSENIIKNIVSMNQPLVEVVNGGVDAGAFQFEQNHFENVASGEDFIRIGQIAEVEVTESVFQNISIQDANLFVVSDTGMFKVQTSSSFENINSETTSGHIFKVASLMVPVSAGETLSVIESITFNDPILFGLFQVANVQQGAIGELEIRDVTVENMREVLSQPFIDLGTYILESDYQFKLTKLSFDKFTISNKFVKLNLNLKLTILIDECTFSQIEGGSMHGQGSLSTNLDFLLKITITNSIISKCNNGNHPFMLVQSNCQYFISDSIFKHNYAFNRGGAFFAFNSPGFVQEGFYCFNCQIYGNYGLEGGAITLLGDNILGHFVQCNIYDNFAFQGGALWIARSAALTVEDSVIKGNRAFIQTLLYTNQAKLIQFNGVTFESDKILSQEEFEEELNTTQVMPERFINFSWGFVYLIKKLKRDVLHSMYLKFTNIDVKECIIQDLKYFASSTTGSILQIISSQISNISLEEKAFINTVFGNAKITSTTFTNINSDRYPLISIEQGSNVYITGCELSDISTTTIFTEGSYIEIIQTKFSDIFTNQFILSNGDTITMQENQFHSLTSQIYAQFSTITDQSSSFQGLTNAVFMYLEFADVTMNGSILNQQDNDSDQQTIFLKLVQSKAEFKTLIISGQKGGVIDALNSQIQIQNSIFRENTGSKGVCLNFQCEISYDGACVAKIEGSVFENNVAELYGGAINYDLFPPVLNNNEFINNEAPYGPNLSGYPERMNVIQMPINFVSGQILINPIVIELRDLDNNIITNDNSSKAILKPVDQSKQQVSGFSEVTAINGIYRFDQVILTAQPGSQEVEFIIQSSAISTQKIEKLQEHDPDKYADLESEIRFKANFRYCEIGEIQNNQNECEICNPGYYSVTANSTECQFCPLNVRCDGGNQLFLNEGYWRPNLTTSEIFLCNSDITCLGGFEPDNPSPVKCAEGHTGRLCQACIVNSASDMWARTGEFECSKCDNSGQMMALIAVGFLLFLSMLALIVQVFVVNQHARINLRKAKDSINSIMFRILTNYFQIVSMSVAFDMAWPDSLKELFSVISVVSKSSGSVLTVDCFLAECKSISSSFKDALQPGQSLFYIRTLLTSLLPFGLILVFIIIWSIVQCKFGGCPFVGRATVVTIVVICFIIHPIIMELTFSLFNCESLGGVLYMTIDLEIECWSGLHSQWALGLGIPLIIFWVIGMPAVGFIILYKNKKRLADLKFLKYYRMMYQGFKPEVFYWEFINTGRKLLLIVINVFLATSSKTVQGLLALFVLVIPLYLQVRLKPFKVETFNTIQMREQLVSFITLYAGSLFVTEEMPEAVQILMIIAIFILNSWFFISWFMVYIQQPFIRKFMTRFCKCTQKLFMDEQQLRVINDMDSLNSSESGRLGNNVAATTEDQKTNNASNQITPHDQVKQKKKRDQGKKKDSGNYKIFDDVMEQSSRALKNNDGSYMSQDSYRIGEPENTLYKKRRRRNKSPSINRVESPISYSRGSKFRVENQKSDDEGSQYIDNISSVELKAFQGDKVLKESGMQQAEDEVFEFGQQLKAKKKKKRNVNKKILNQIEEETKQ